MEFLLTISRCFFSITEKLVKEQASVKTDLEMAVYLSISLSTCACEFMIVHLCGLIFVSHNLLRLVRVSISCQYR